MEGCTRMIVGVYKDLKYTFANCDECRHMVGGQTSHRCYYLNSRMFAEDRMTSALIGLQGKQWELFAKMREVMREKQPLYDHLKAAEMLEFFEQPIYRLHPLEEVAVRSDWKEKVVGAALKMENYPDIYIGGNVYDDGGLYCSQREDEEEEEEKEEGVGAVKELSLGTPPLRFSGELSQDMT